MSIIFTCEQCSMQFAPSRIGQIRRFCSTTCCNKFKFKNNSMCLYCKQETSNPKFCSRSCSAIFNNTGKVKSDETKKKLSESIKSIQRTKPKIIKQVQIKQNNPINRLSKNLPRQKKILSPEEQYQKYKKYRARMNEANARYMARRKFQTPAGEDIKALQRFYENCPIGHEVDHIIPISKGGLHALTNLQYLPKHINRKKSNKLNWQAHQDSNPEF